MWQPIETAPKDGTMIDVWVDRGDGGERVADVYWGTCTFPGDGKEFTGWTESSGSIGEPVPIRGNNDEDGVVIHWMPRPAPPTDEERSMADYLHNICLANEFGTKNDRIYFNR